MRYGSKYVDLRAFGAKVDLRAFGAKADLCAFGAKVCAKVNFTFTLFHPFIY